MSQRQLFTAHPDPETDNREQDLNEIDEALVSRYGISDQPYNEVPSVHPDYTENTGQGEAHNTVTYSDRSNAGKRDTAEDILSMTPAEYVSLVHSSDHMWDANGWVYFEEDGELRSEAFFGEEDEEGRDVKWDIKDEFGVSTNVPFF